eukprot:10562538-Lingulodinium_polyedra.AAC.1
MDGGPKRRRLLHWRRGLRWQQNGYLAPNSAALLWPPRNWRPAAVAWGPLPLDLPAQCRNLRAALYA